MGRKIATCGHWQRQKHSYSSQGEAWMPYPLQKYQLGSTILPLVSRTMHPAKKEGKVRLGSSPLTMVVDLHSGNQPWQRNIHYMYRWIFPFPPPWSSMYLLVFMATFDYWRLIFLGKKNNTSSASSGSPLAASLLNLLHESWNVNHHPVANEVLASLHGVGSSG